MIPFDFPNLRQDDISQRYQRSGYYNRKNPHFRFDMVFPKDWKIVQITEPLELPDESIPVEIGVLNRYEIPEDPQSDILAAIYITAVRIPSSWSNVEALEKITEYLLRGYKSKILKSQEYEFTTTTLKDILLTYEIPQDRIYWSRFTGFKVKDETRIYFAGEKDIFYLIHLHTSEEHYKNFAAEAFYVAKISFQFIQASEDSHGSTPQTEGTASGSVSLNGEKVGLNYAYALAQPNAFDEGRLDIAVLLIEKPIGENELENAERLEIVASQKENYAFFKIDDQRKPIYEMIHHPLLKDERLVMSGFTNAQFVPKVFNDEHIEGEFRTEEPIDFCGYQYEIDVKFNTKIMQAKLPEPLPDEKSGKALPSGGGEPLKGYLAYLEAIEKKDFATIHRLSQPSPGMEMSIEDIKENIEFMQMMAPKDLKMVKGYVNPAEDRAILYVTGLQEGEKAYGTIVMVRKDHLWMVAQESWSDRPPEK